jgi:hypothetical protein
MRRAYKQRTNTYNSSTPTWGVALTARVVARTKVLAVPFTSRSILKHSR